MIRFFIFLLFIISFVDARENPFFPSDGEVDMIITSNQVKKLSPLKRVAVTLPSSARTIQSMTITYKDLDGSIHDKKEILGNSIDWHIPLFLSQNIDDTASNKKKVPLKIKTKKFVKIATLKFISLYSKDNEIKITTKDKLLRKFLLVKPHRIVCDFRREIDIRSYEKNVKNEGLVTRVRVGNHSGYYRVVIELDGYYRYKSKKIADGYIFSLL
ncbi:AMIN domain-containing protein [Sulfurimonas sp.]|jgi:hypothetical protein|uniref:AMIN domain-containing protein n=1 Tax=Sulfurimonas sp. TaxID=2022749 RepID=UPI0025CF58B9|nr:AMIN domain-containing protein [Sulfurimonas sp.]MBT5935814.1 AMIN domain-containing protein [Sulfurimonas sp.]